MEKTLVKQIYRETDKFMGKQVEISGWVRTLRASNAFGFIELNDGSFFKNIQIVFESNINNFKDISKL
ncbi:asparagine--tRNA ligase, partial [bacterium]|nr:asparagine--tRNA ligase [bacterium]